jgi:PTK7 protein tyrosine kinase 7
VVIILIYLLCCLGHGQFGEVFVAKARGMRGSSSDDEGVVVMVKSLQTRDEAALHDFKREMDMHHKLRHENIARLLGLCRDADPHLMITEYTDWVSHAIRSYTYKCILFFTVVRITLILCRAPI